MILRPLKEKVLEIVNENEVISLAKLKAFFHAERNGNLEKALKELNEKGKISLHNNHAYKA